ncbi:MAG TPA: glycosyltransferase family 39 protein [Chthoniobacterales bacterium]|jgi:4-amino-4-deoxy-L-arabinose transferase-like glycosyltransferase
MEPRNRNRPPVSITLLVCLASGTIIAHFFIGDGYGFHRDELATLDDARHLAWGYIAYPPVTPFFGRLSLALFGTSLVGFRFFASLAAAGSIVLTGLIAREMRGGRMAQLIAAVASMPFCLACGSLMQYVAFDYLCWVLTAYFVVRLINSGNPRWWLAIGAAVGFGMLTKYSILFFVAGIVIGVLATNLRSELKSKWVWIGAVCSVLIFLPNLWWQINHHFISLDFLRHIHERDVRIGRTKDFLPDQVLLTLFGFPIAVAGLLYCWFSRDAVRFRVLGWMYVVPLLLFLLAQGRGYYLAPAYSILYAAGAVWLESQLMRMSRSSFRTAVVCVITILLLVNVSVAAAVALPIAPINSKWWAFASKNNGDLVEEIGWPDLVETIAQIRDRLPANERARVGILAGNYGEAGAVNLYGSNYRLPRAICGTNSFWARGYGDPSPEIVIVVGFSRKFAETYFDSFEMAAQSRNRYGVANEESRDHPEIFVCRGFRKNWPEFWKTFQRYG